MASDVGELSAVVQSFIRPSTDYTGGPGCGIVSDSATSFGQPFNELDGGVFATTWDGDGVKICMSSFIFTLQAESCCYRELEPSTNTRRVRSTCFGIVIRLIRPVSRPTLLIQELVG
jgi:hypothetical protein